MSEFNDNQNNDKTAIWTIIIAVVLVFISPFIFSQFKSGISFIGKGEIGDTIGGITSPIIGIMGAILVYLALKEQVKANNFIQIQLNNDKNKEVQRLHNIKSLILWDLKMNILEKLKKQDEELIGAIKIFQQNDNPSLFVLNHNYNFDTYNSVLKIDLFSIFNDDFYILTSIYNRAEIVKNYTYKNFIDEISDIYTTTNNNEVMRDFKIKKMVDTYEHNSKVSQEIQMNIKSFVSKYE